MAALIGLRSLGRRFRHGRRPRRWAPLVFLAPLLLAAQKWTRPFEQWHRVSDLPILSPQGQTWESAGTFNPAVQLVPDQSGSKSGPESKVVMLYRAQDASGTSRLGYAE